MKKTTKTGCRKTENGDTLQIYCNQISAYPLLDFDEELALARLVQQGDQNAFHKLIQSNLRLVMKIARPYTAQDVPFMDLVQEGNLGLIHAAEKYNPNKKARFCTYASWWIRQFIVRYLTNKRRMVRLPHRKEETLRKIQRTYHTLSQTLMHQPQTKDIADELGISVKDIDLIINMSSGPLPLEMDHDLDDNAAVIETHEDYTYSPERSLFRQYYRDRARRFLDRLVDRERQVLSYRYQLDNNEHHTLKEIGAKLNVSPETVRQIEKKALAKIRSQNEDLLEFGFPEAI